MIDTLATLRTHLLTMTSLVNLVGNRIYAGAPYPPVEYMPGQAAITFASRGGSLSYDRRLITESFTFKCYGAGELGAMTVYRTLADGLDDSRGVNIRNAALEVVGVLLYEEDPVNWPFVLAFFQVVFNRGV